MFLSKFKRLAARLMILSLLVIGLLLPMTTAENKAYAAADCSQCEADYQECLNQCVYDPGWCANYCETVYTRCLRFCQGD